MICMLMMAGCSKEKLQDFADTVQKEGESLVIESKKMTDSLVETAKEQLPETGKMTIQTPEPIQLDRAVVKLHSIGDGRKNSLQITSYDPGAARVSAPAVFIHSTTDVQTVALAAGQSIPCNLFVELKPGTPIARNPIGKPVAVTFGSMNMKEKTITATISPCTLVGSDNQPVSIGGGDILAVVLED